MIPGGKINIYNIYNPPNSNEACVAIHAWLMEHPTEESDCTIWAGDFNKHDPMWTNPAHHARCECSDTETLMQLIAEHQLMLALPAGTLTYQSDSHGTWSTLDLVFCDQATHGRILTCNASIEDRLPSADHLPIHTILDIAIRPADRTPARNFRGVDWEKFNKTLSYLLNSKMPHADTVPSTTEALDEYIDKLTDTIRQTICQHVPQSRAGPYTKRWWTPELT